MGDGGGPPTATPRFELAFTDPVSMTQPSAAGMLAPATQKATTTGIFMHPPASILLRFLLS
jgi:hypothetical protein